MTWFDSRPLRPGHRVRLMFLDGLVLLPDGNRAIPIVFLRPWAPEGETLVIESVEPAGDATPDGVAYRFVGLLAIYART